MVDRDQLRESIRDYMERNRVSNFDMAKAMGLNANTLRMFLLGGNSHPATILVMGMFMDEALKKELTEQK